MRRGEGEGGFAQGHKFSPKNTTSKKIISPANIEFIISFALAFFGGELEEMNAAAQDRPGAPMMTFMIKLCPRSR